MGPAEAVADSERHSDDRGAAPRTIVLRSLAAAAVPTGVLFAVPQQAYGPFGPLAVLLVVLAGAVLLGVAIARAVCSASRTAAQATRGAGAYFFLSGACFVITCVVAPAAPLIGAHAWYGFRSIEPRDIVMAAVAGGVLLLAAVFAVAGAALLRSTDSSLRVVVARVDLAAQLYGLTAVLATVAILY